MYMYMYKHSNMLAYMQLTCEFIPSFYVHVHGRYRLVGSDHRRNIRPKFRQKASSSHLKILGTREGVSSELLTSTDDDSRLQLDPNTYSTYMGK